MIKEITSVNNLHIHVFKCIVHECLENKNYAVFTIFISSPSTLFGKMEWGIEKNEEHEDMEDKQQKDIVTLSTVLAHSKCSIFNE